MFGAALALVAGGFGAAQVFNMLSLATVRTTSFDDLPALAEDLNLTAIKQTTGATAPQITQVHAELNSRLQYIQIKQNAEIIRLLNVIADKK